MEVSKSRNGLLEGGRDRNPLCLPILTLGKTGLVGERKLGG